MNTLDKLRDLSRLEILVLLSFFFTLPLFRGVKNTLIVLYCLIWLVESWKNNNYGGKIRRWEYALIAFMLGGFISSFTNPFGWEDPVSGTFTFIKIILPALLLSRVSIKRDQVKMIAVATVAGTFLAVLASWVVWNKTGSEYPELHSVGHVNQSALYMALSFGIASSLFLTSNKNEKIIYLLLTVFFALAMIPTKSFAAIAVVFTMACLLFLQPNIKFLVTAIFSVVVAVAGILLTSKSIAPVGNLVSKIEYRLSDGDDAHNRLLSYRDVIYNASVVALKDFPLFGAGSRNFNKATSYEYIKSALEKRGLEYTEGKYLHTNHGHNMITSIMTDRGLFGLSMILIFLFISASLHLQWYYKFFTGREADIYPLLGLVSGVYIVVGGFGNSTLYVEHGQLAFCLLGVSMGYLQKSMKDVTIVKNYAGS